MKTPKQASLGSSTGVTSALIRLGRVIGVHGLRGAIRFRPDDPGSDSITILVRLFIEREGETREYRIAGASQLGRGTVRLILEGVDDVNAAEELKGGIVMAAENDLPPLEQHEFYYHQAIGCEVLLPDGKSIGKVVEVFSAGASDVFVVRGEREILVPAIADVVKSIDLGAHRIVIDPVPGLLD